MENTTPQGDIGLIGLAVMGQNLVLNMNDHGYTVVVYNRTTSKVDDFLAKEAKGTKVQGAHSIEELVSKLKRPRRIMMLVKAGQAVDDFIAQIAPHLEKGDIIIDGGNSLFGDSNRRQRELEAKGLLFIGTGVSGGEEGARRGPSIMPGGSPEAWPHVKEIFQSISAKVEDGSPCCDWVGEEGSGHYVKMVHNGIEYGMMAAFAEGLAIFEAADEMTPAYDLDIPAITEVWRRGSVVASWLLDLTAQALVESSELKEYSTEVSDSGEGRWTVQAAIEAGIPAHVLSASLYARFASRNNDEFANRVLSAMRYKFGGHNEKPQAPGNATK